MKSLAVVSFFSLAVLFGPSTGAQTMAPPVPPMSGPAVPPYQQAPQVQPGQPQLGPPEGRLPGQDPQDFANDQANEAQPQAPLPLPDGDDAALGMTAPQPQYDPNNPGDPNNPANPANPYLAYPPVDLGPDNDIAQTYDDGYDPQAYTQFQNELAPYGSWSNDPTYGNVWSPYAQTVGTDFVPYASCGHWLMSEYGWTWISDWNWGWAPFHYGRWTTIAGRGWSWIPGTMWGPGWVSWRSGHGYVGWSPLPPRGSTLFAGSGARSPWRFTTAAALGAAHPSFLSTRYLPSLFARTTVVANDRLLTRGQWAVHVNAGPTRGVSATPVHLATAAPRALPHVAVYPHAGVALSARPWMRTQSVAARSGGYGQPAHGQATSGNSGYGQSGHGQSAYGRGGYGQGWNAGAAPQHTVGRTPAYGPAAARPEVRAPATAWSRPAQTYGNAGSYGRPYAAGSYSPAARPYAAAPSYGNPQPAYRAAPTSGPAYYHAPAASYAPVQRSYAPPAARFEGGGSGFSGGGSASHFGGGSASFGGGGGGSHFGGGGGGSHFGGGGGHRR
jgi:hypothetical protein